MLAPRRLSARLVLSCLFVCALALTRAQTPVSTARFDILIAGGRLVDGTGAPWVRADVGITGDHIEAVGALGRDNARAVIDATDMAYPDCSLHPAWLRQRTDCAERTRPDRHGLELERRAELDERHGRDQLRRPAL